MPVSTKSCTPKNAAEPKIVATFIQVKPAAEYRVYRRRWLILSLFVFYSCINLMQWIQYSIIADVIIVYYGVSYTAADWCSLIFLLLYIPFSFPGGYLLDKLGLRIAVLVGMFATCVGAWIKVASAAPDRYWVVLVGQSFVAIAEVLILPVPPKLAAVWFGPNEVSSACSIGIFGTQLGMAVGYLLPPLLVNRHMEEDLIGNRLHLMSIAVAIICSVCMLVLFLCFQDAPPTAPYAMQNQLLEDKTSFIKSLQKLIWNPTYALFLLAYSINTGIYYAVSMLLNQIVLKYHPDGGADAGVIGVIMIVSGMVGSLLCGVILDKFNQFKATSLALYVMALVGIVALHFVVDGSIKAIYFVSGLLGFSMAGFLMTGLEVGVELTYPVEEGTSGGILTVSAQIVGIFYTYLYSFLFRKVSDFWANFTMVLSLTVGILIMACLRFDLRRQRSRKMVELCR